MKASPREAQPRRWPHRSFITATTPSVSATGTCPIAAYRSGRNVRVVPRSAGEDAGGGLLNEGRDRSRDGRHHEAAIRTHPSRGGCCVVEDSTPSPTLPR